MEQTKQLAMKMASLNDELQQSREKAGLENKTLEDDLHRLKQEKNQLQLLLQESESNIAKAVAEAVAEVTASLARKEVDKSEAIEKKYKKMMDENREEKDKLKNDLTWQQKENQKLAAAVSMNEKEANQMKSKMDEIAAKYADSEKVALREKESGDDARKQMVLLLLIIVI